MGKETKILEVGPSEVNSTIEFWGSFGWDVISTTTIDTRDVQYVNGDVRQGFLTDNLYQEVKEVHTGSKYVSITFQRDTRMPNYEKIVALEKAHFSEEPKPPVKPVLDSKPTYSLPGKVTISTVLFSVIFLVLTVTTGDFILLGIAMLFIGLTIYNYVNHEKRCEKYEERHKKRVAEHKIAEEKHPEKMKRYKAEYAKYEEAVKTKREALGRARALSK